VNVFLLKHGVVAVVRDRL